MQEFLTELQKALTNKMSAEEVAQHVNYYREYIEVEIRKGRTEEEVIAELGNPRLIARSILDAASGKHGHLAGSDSSDDAGEGKKSFAEYILGLSAWLRLLVLILAIMVAASLFISVLRIFLPVLIPLVFIIILIKWWNSNR